MTAQPTTTDTIVNIASALDIMAAQLPNKPAIIMPHGRDDANRVSYVHYTYAQLVDASNQVARGLEKHGITRGMRTTVMVTPSLEFFALMFGMFRAGIIPILIDPGMGTKNLKTCLAEAEPEAFIGIIKAQVARSLLGWGKTTIKKVVTVGNSRLWGGPTLSDVMQSGRSSEPYIPADTKVDDTAAIIFTSGSTGIPKGVIYQHGNFMGQVRALRDTLNIEPGEINLPTFPPFALFDPALGVTTVIPDMDFTRPANVDPRKIIEPIENFGVTMMFGSPALLNTVSRYCVDHDVHFPTLRRVLSAGAPVPAATLERMARSLNPDVEIYTPYGATEALPVAIVGSHEILTETRHRTDQGAGVCIGKPVSGAKVWVIGISDDPIEKWDESLVLPLNRVGEIVVMSENVTIGYFNREPATRLAKIRYHDGRVMHRMGDLGYFDEQGRLWFSGRKSHRVETADGAMYTVMIERIFDTHPQVYRTALVGVQRNGNTEPVLCVELEPNARQADTRQITEELLEIGRQHPLTQSINHILFHPAFPVDIRHNSKIFREKLGPWAQENLKA